MPLTYGAGNYGPDFRIAMVEKLGPQIKVVGRVPMSSRGSKDCAAVVAASGATHRMEWMADYRCDGVEDDVEIQEAVDDLP